MYAARLAEEEASTPVTWWYTPIYCSVSHRLSVGYCWGTAKLVAYMFARVAGLLFQKVDKVRRT